MEQQAAREERAESESQRLFDEEVDDTEMNESQDVKTGRHAGQ